MLKKFSKEIKKNPEIRKRKKRPKKCILHEDEVDGMSEPDTDPQVSEEEQEQEAKPEINEN